MKKSTTACIAASLAALMLSPIAISHFNDKEIPQSYRQSWFALVAANFGPMAAMVKGDMPYDQKAMQAFADDLVTLNELNAMRGFSDGSDKGTTRAKPGIWENKDDFQQKMKDFSEAATALQAAVGSEDREAIAKAVGATGGTCKGCHDDYKSKDYLY